MSGFNEAVADWLRGRGLTVEVTEVRGHGTDWRGSTEDGYSSGFDVDISYVTAAGEATMTTVEGEDLASLWAHVVGAWPRTCLCVCHDPDDPRKAVHGTGPCICTVRMRR